MAEQSKSLEMRVAELEDKLSKVHITEEEMKAYHKVAALMGGGGGTANLSPQLCAIYRCIVYRCIISICVCNECTCGPCACLTSSGGSSGGFGGLGS